MQGYLVDWHAWNEDVAQEIATEEHIILTEDHWQVLRYLRYFYQEYNHTPIMRILVKQLREVLPPEKTNSPYLYTLFPQGPVKQGCKIAGLPKPPHCI
jgi:tRNA 2-thiouridine synthesizing protein E